MWFKPYNSMERIEKALKEAVYDGVCECTGCGANIEPDCEKCGECGTAGLLTELGLI